MQVRFVGLCSIQLQQVLLGLYEEPIRYLEQG